MHILNKDLICNNTIHIIGVKIIFHMQITTTAYVLF